MSPEISSHEVELLVRPTDLDVLGHCNNARVLELLETARWQWNDRIPIHQSQYVPVIARIEVDYRREILPGEVRIRTWIDTESRQRILSKSRSRRLTFCQEIINPSGVLLVSARVDIACIDIKSRKSVPVRALLDARVLTLDDQGLPRPANAIPSAIEPQARSFPDECGGPTISE